MDIEICILDSKQNAKIDDPTEVGVYPNFDVYRINADEELIEEHPGAQSFIALEFERDNSEEIERLEGILKKVSTLEKLAELQEKPTTETSTSLFKLLLEMEGEVKEWLTELKDYK